MKYFVIPVFIGATGIVTKEVERKFRKQYQGNIQ
jgi:hypothetical protein